MDLTPELALQTLSPSTAYLSSAPTREAVGTVKLNSSTEWDLSLSNPKNRINSFAPVKNPKWRIDGCTSLGTRYFTIPTIIYPLPPLRIDTFLPQPSTWPPGLRHELAIDKSFWYRDERVLNFGIAQHVLRVLELWSGSMENFEDFYVTLPLGSRILFHNMDKDISKIRVQVIRTYDIERQLLSISSVRSRLSETAVTLPQCLDISQLSLLRQLQDSTSLVQVHSTSGDGVLRTAIFKTFSDSPKYLYHELDILLSMPEHPNIICHPLNIVTKRCRFGGKVGIVGFILPYLRKGSLRDILPFRSIHSTLLLEDQLKWSLQLIAALQHIRDKGPQFYCDLRLDNILLSDTDDVLLIDFEQRGVLHSFAAPEDSYLQYIEGLANDPSSNNTVREEYQGLYSRYIAPHIPHLRDTHKGCITWLCLTPVERQRAEVYMLGRLLWCIFEGVSAPQRELWMEYFHEPDIEFPEFNKTPLELRELIKNCSERWPRACDVLKKFGKQQIVSNTYLGLPSKKAMNSSFSNSEPLTQIWNKELQEAKAFLEKRHRVMNMGSDLCDIYPHTPLLEMVAKQLLNFRKKGTEIQTKADRV